MDDIHTVVGVFHIVLFSPPKSADFKKFMTAGLKTDPSVVAEVVERKMKEPRTTMRQFEREGIVPRQTAQDILTRHFGQLRQEADWIKAIQQIDAENIALGGLVVQNTLVKNEGGVEARNLSGVASVMADATKRRQLMTGGSTENIAVGVKTYLPEKGE